MRDWMARFLQAMSIEDVEDVMRCLDAPACSSCCMGTCWKARRRCGSFERTCSQHDDMFTGRSTKSNTGPLEKVFLPVAGARFNSKPRMALDPDWKHAGRTPGSR